MQTIQHATFSARVSFLSFKLELQKQLLTAAQREIRPKRKMQALAEIIFSR